jgi:hypothetical protein
MGGPELVLTRAQYIVTTGDPGALLAKGALE